MCVPKCSHIACLFTWCDVFIWMNPYSLVLLTKPYATEPVIFGVCVFDSFTSTRVKQSQSPGEAQFRWTKHCRWEQRNTLAAALVIKPVIVSCWLKVVLGDEQWKKLVFQSTRTQMQQLGWFQYFKISSFHGPVTSLPLSFSLATLLTETQRTVAREDAKGLWERGRERALPLMSFSRRKTKQKNEKETNSRAEVQQSPSLPVFIQIWTHYQQHV